MTVIRFILVILLSYVLGCSNMALYLSKLRGVDMRKGGSGNLGASNAMILMGWKVGIIVAVHDIGKAVVAVVLAKHFCPGLPLIGAAAGVACVLGHMFPFYLRFRGGKGTACLCGTVLGLTPELVLPLLALMFIIGMIWNRASILPLLTALVYAPLYLLRTGDWRGTIALALIFPAMLWAHRTNFARWREGKEQTFRQFLFGRHEPQREEAGE